MEPDSITKARKYLFGQICNLARQGQSGHLLIQSFDLEALDRWLVLVNRRLLPTGLQIPRLPQWARIANPAQHNTQN